MFFYNTAAAIFLNGLINELALDHKKITNMTHVLVNKFLLTTNNFNLIIVNLPVSATRLPIRTGSLVLVAY